MSRYKFDRSCEFITGYKFGGGHWRSVAVQTISKPEICNGAGFKLRVDARVRVQEPLQIYLGSRSKSKKCDKQLTHIVRVSGAFLFFSYIYPNCLATTNEIVKTIIVNIISESTIILRILFGLINLQTERINKMIK